VRTPTPVTGEIQGILSRDAVGTDFGGHISVALGPTGAVWVRMQQIAGGLSVFRCGAAPLPVDQWVHLGISFGPPEGFRLWLDHQPATGTSVLFEPGGSIEDCTVAHGLGIAGNDNTLAFGGLLFLAPNSDPAPAIARPFTNGQIDQVHIHSTAHDFGVE
jgi:hypothetical protein